MPRSFLAVVPQEALLTKLEELSQDLRRAVEDTGLKVRWVAPSLLHVTLRFLGDVSEERLVGVKRALSEVALHYAPFEVLVSGVGFLPSQRRPRVIFAELGASALSSITEELEERLLALRFSAADHPFRPHITLGRIREARRAPEFFARAVSLGQGLLAPSFAVREIVLFQSDLRPSGPVYIPLARVSLRGS